MPPDTHNFGDGAQSSTLAPTMENQYEPNDNGSIEPAPESAGCGPQPTDAETLCIDCGYSLRGLPVDGKCPECGKPVADSIRGELLINRSPEYVRKLTRGISLVLNGILLWFVLKILAGPALTIALPIFQYNAGNFYVSPPLIDFALALAGFLVSGMIFYGYWLFTARDPGDPVRNRATAARVVVRAAVITQLVGQLFSLVGSTMMLSIGAQSVVPNPSSGAVAGQLLLAATLLLAFAKLVTFAAWATQFFSAMLYVSMLSRRLPDPKIFRLANSRIISCPIWATVGILILVGPLIALILYWNLLNMVRARLKHIRNAQQHEAMDKQIAGLAG